MELSRNFITSGMVTQFCSLPHPGTVLSQDTPNFRNFRDVLCARLGLIGATSSRHPMSLAVPPALSLSPGGHIRCWGDPERLWGRFLGCLRARSPSILCLVCPFPSPPSCRGGQKTPQPRGKSSGATERHPRNLHPELLVLEPPSSCPGTLGILKSAAAARH